MIIHLKTPALRELVRLAHAEGREPRAMAALILERALLSTIDNAPTLPRPSEGLKTGRSPDAA